MSLIRRRAPFFIIFVAIWGLTTHGKYSVSGDEPHYLIIAESLLSDRDLDLANNYDNDDGRRFGHAGLRNDGHAWRTPAGRLESAHDIGLPVLLLPVYAAARGIGELVPAPLIARARMNRGLFVYSLVSLTLIAAVAWGCVWLLRGLEAVWPDRRVPYLLYLVALSPPVLSHAFLVFPETVMFVVVCLTIGTAAAAGSAPMSSGRLAAVALALGAAPWLHRKFTPLVLALAAAWWWTARGNIQRWRPAGLLVLASLVVVPIALLYLWTWEHWGTIAGPQFARGSRLDPARLPSGLLALFADRRSGLLAYAPFYLVLPACLLLAARRQAPWLAAAATLAVPMAAFDEWWAGFSPAARYLVPVIPIAALGLAEGARRPGIRYALVALGICQVVINATVWQRPRLLWPQPDAMNPMLEALGPAGGFWHAALPDVRRGVTAGSAILFLTALAAVTLLLRGRQLRPAAGPAITEPPAA